jgi:hypothetical protein
VGNVAFSGNFLFYSNLKTSEFQLSTFVDDVFHGSLRKNTVSRLRLLKDLFQLRSNYASNIRTCPAAMFSLEATSKVLFLTVVALYIQHYDDQNYFQLRVFLFVMFVANILHEFGELIERGSQYFVCYQFILCC